MYATIEDVYVEYVVRSGEDGPARTVEEIRSAVQASVRRYEWVDEEWWDGLDGAWLAGVEGALPWLYNDEWNARYRWLESLRGPWCSRLPEPKADSVGVER